MRPEWEEGSHHSKGWSERKNKYKEPEKELGMLEEWNESQCRYNKLYENKSGATGDLKVKQLIAEDFGKTTISA